MFQMSEYFKDPKVTFEIGVQQKWRNTPAVLMNKVGTELLRVERNIQLKSIQHIPTRGSSLFELTLPNSGEVGIYFETDWNQSQIVVKKVKSGSWAANYTDVEKGDVLLTISVNNVATTALGTQFDEAMALLKLRSNENKIVVTMRLWEEKLRLLQTQKPGEMPDDLTGNASPCNSLFFRINNPTSLCLDTPRNLQPSENEDFDETLVVKVDVQTNINSTTFAIVSADSAESSEYKIVNDSMCHVIQFKQRGVLGNKWTFLQPRSGIYYIWDDPCKRQKRLLLRIVSNILCPRISHKVSKEYIEPAVIDFEKIKLKEPVKIFGEEGKKLCAVIEADGIFQYFF